MAKLNKNDIATQVAEEAGISSGDAKNALDKTFEVIAARLEAGDEIAFAGFGKFSVSQRAAREGRNPQTGETMQIKASTVPKFSAGKALKDRVNK